jgi:hypothetical protein
MTYGSETLRNIEIFIPVGHEHRDLVSRSVSRVYSNDIAYLGLGPVHAHLLFLAAVGGHLALGGGSVGSCSGHYERQS